MILSTHAVIGAAVASLFPGKPILGVSVAFLSHFLLDAIPHWDYNLRSKHQNPLDPLKDDLPFKFNRDYFLDVLKLGLDFFVGIFLSVLIFWHHTHSWQLLLAGALAGVLPDFLQFVYWKVRREPLTSLQRFHFWLHPEAKITQAVPGIFSQALLVVVVVLLSIYLGG